MIDESQNRRFYAVNHKNDIPKTERGILIPNIKKSVKSRNTFNKNITLALLPITAILLLIGIGAVGAQAVSSMNTASVPQVSIINPYTSETEPLNYGVQLSFAEPNFFNETRNAFIDSALTFVEVDLLDMKLRYFEEGVLVENIIIQSKAETGSWCKTPAGLYKIEAKNKNHFSSVGQVYQPWSLSFQSNFFIHGWSNFANDSSVPNDFTGDCIRLNSDDAERLFGLIKVNTPVLVHEENSEGKPFLYEPKIPEIKTPHYLIADIDSNTVLASSDLDAPAPIASVTKLMTALITAEYINLDKNVTVNHSTFVQSLIPRLGDRNQVSMYSLLQLLLVESSNEAAEIIADQLGRENFIKYMNQKAEDIGMTNTHFIDPSGLGAENISSLSDLLRLSKYIHTNRNFIFELTANQHLPTSYVGDEFGELSNFNEIEGLENFIGGKVGETNAAGQTSVSLHRLSVKGTERVIAIIILGSEDRSHDVTELLHYAEDRFGE